MEDIKDKKYTNERYLAYGIIEKIKYKAATLPSKNPKHLNNSKYLISKKEFENVINSEFEKRNLSPNKREMIKNFINYKLVPA